MRALRIVGDEPAAVEAAERGNPVGMRRRDPQAEPGAHAVAGDGERLVGVLRQLVEVRGAVGGQPLRRELPHERPDPPEELATGLSELMSGNGMTGERPAR